MILKEFRELRRDRRTLGMMIVMPLLLLVVFGYAANFYVSNVKTAIVGPQATQAAALLPDFFDVTVLEPTQTQADGERLLRDNKVSVVLVTGQQPALALVDGSNLFAAQVIVSVLNRFSDKVTTQVLFNPELKTSWVMIPAIIGLILTFIGTIVTSIGLVRERESGTLEQLAVMPIKPGAVIIGKIAPYFLVASIDLAIITVLGMVLFGVPMNGNALVLGLGAALFLFVVLGLGVFISTISQTTGQAIQTAFFFLLPQILLSGMIFPLDAMAVGVRWIGYLLPLTYFTMISKGVMLRGASLTSLVAAVHRAHRHGPRRLHGSHAQVPPRPRPRAPPPGAQRDRVVMTYFVRNATAVFGDTVALDDVTLEVEPGSVVAVVGGDGAGKTTLLRSLVGEVRLQAARSTPRRPRPWATCPPARAAGPP